MDRKIRNGTIIKLEDPDKAFVIVDNIIKNEKQYVVISPYEQEEIKGTIRIDYKKLSIIELKDNDDYEYVEDVKLIKSLVEEMMNK